MASPKKFGSYNKKSNDDDSSSSDESDIDESDIKLSLDKSKKSSSTNERRDREIYGDDGLYEEIDNVISAGDDDEYLSKYDSDDRDFSVVVDDDNISISIELDDTTYDLVWDGNDFKDMGKNDGKWDYKNLHFMDTARRIAKKYYPKERSDEISTPKRKTPVSTKDSIFKIGSPKSPQTITEWLASVGCDLDEYMENIRVLADKGSSSDSVILFGDLNMNGKKQPVVFKIVFESQSTFINSLKVEQQIYTNVTEGMLNNFHTPHLTSCIGVINMCSTKDITDKLLKDQLKNFTTALNKIDGGLYDKKKAHILILGQSSGKTLYDYINPSNVLYKTIDTNDRFNILFQLLYTLRCFEKVGLRHNDLHAKNIFVDKLTTPEERIYYISDDVWVKILVKYDTKIFDFDRAAIYHPSVDRNFVLDLGDYCQDYDQCNKYDSRTDLASIVSGFINIETNIKVRTFLKTCMSGLFFQSLYNRPYPHLNAIKNDRGEIIHGPDITDDKLQSIAVCIDKLVNCPDFVKTKGSGRSVGKIYILPPPIKTVMWNPTTSISHQSLSTKLDPNPVSDYLGDVYIDSLKLDGIIKSPNIYEKEFGKEYLRDSTKTLFKEFIKRKNVIKTNHLICKAACYIICIPFTYKLSSTDIKKFLKSSTRLVNREPIQKIISDIWNVFNGTLPIEMIKV